MTIPVDNQIIDFNTINNIYTTLANHEDVFSAIENKSIVQGVDRTSGSGLASVLNVASMQIVTVRDSAPPGAYTVVFPANFSSAPAVTVTCEQANSGSSTFVAQITKNGDGAGGYGSVDVYIYDAQNKKTTNKVILNVIAIGSSTR